MSYFKSARLKFEERNYEAALELYKIAGNVFGIEMVQFNIYECNKNLGLNHELLSDLREKSLEIVKKEIARVSEVDFTRGGVLKPEEVIFLIPTCKKFDFKRQAIRDTWVSDLKKYNIRFLFLMGDEESSSSRVEGDTLFLPCADDYESLLLKLMLGYEYVYKNFEFSYIYKIDDDCYPNVRYLVENLLPQFSYAPYIGGAILEGGAKINDKWHFGKCSKPEFDKPYKTNVSPVSFAKGGYGYFLRKNIMPILFSEIPRFKSELENYIYSYEDLRVAEVLSGSGVYVKQLELYSIAKGDSNIGPGFYLYYDISMEGNYHRIKEFS